MVKGLFDKALTEKGIFYIVATISIMFSAWLVINFEADPGIFFGYTIFLLIAIVYRFMEESDYFESFKLFNEKNPLIDIGVGILFSVVWYFLVFPTRYGIIPLPPLPAEVLAIGPAPFLIVVLLAPIAEEYLFRGSLLPQLQEIFNSKYSSIIAVLLTAAAFTAFHWTVYLQGALSSALIASFLFGLFVGGIAAWRKSILPTIIIHAIINFAIVSPMFAIIL